MKPNMTVLGLKEGSKFFVPHYYEMVELYKPSRIVPIESKSVMYVQESLRSLDYWNLDSDFFYTEDSIGHQNLLQCSGNSFAYFSGFLKVYRIAHGLFEQDSMLKFDWSKNKAHVIDIYNNLLVSDVILISPVLREIFDRILPEFFSKKLLKQISSRYLVLPPPDLYKLEIKNKKKDWSSLNFLWNHRFIESKNYKAFFSIIEKLVEQHPEIPIQIKVLSANTEQEVMKLVPKALQKTIDYHPFTSDKQKYEKLVDETNITIGTSKIESFGISVFDSVARGLALINLDCNKAFTQIVGPSTTFSQADAVKALYKTWKSKDFRTKVLNYNMRGLKTLPGRDEFTRQFSDRLQSIFDAKLEARATKSEKLKTMVGAIEKKPMTKRDLYAAIGWQVSKTCVNTFWSDYYYGLRKLGVHTSFIDGTVWYHMKGAKPKSVNKGHSSRKGLF